MDHVVLAYSPNQCYVHAHPWFKVDGVSVDADGWGYAGRRYRFNDTVPMATLQPADNKIIGVFSTDNPGLNAMLSAAHDATHQRRGCYDGD